MEGDETLTKEESFIWRTELVCMFFSFSSDSTSWAKEIEALYLQKCKNNCS